jgi:Ferritin-like domain
VKPKDRNELPISERELDGMTADLADAHHETLPALHETLGAWEADTDDEPEGLLALTGGTASRRGFLLGTGALLGGAALVAAGGGRGATAFAAGLPSGTRSGRPQAQKLTGDLAVVALAASLENLAVATYQSGIQAAQAGHLGTVPAAVVTFATTAQSQHRDHAAAWNAVLTSAKETKVTGVDLTVKNGVIDPAFAQVTDVTGLAKLALELENVAAATYLAAIGVVKNPAGIQTAATIEPVEEQHAAILNFVLGQYPVPNSFTPTTGARPTSDQIG